MIILDGRFVAGAALAFLWQVVMHWLPWHMFISKHISTHKLTSYTLGTLGLLAGVAVVDVNAAAIGMVMAVASGLGTLASYGLRTVGEWYQEVRARRIREDV